jgi:nucleotide-binding universal stress UspA family protein
MMHNVLVPLDGSRVSEKVLDPVVRLLARSEGNLILFHAVAPSDLLSPAASENLRLERSRSASYLQEMAERAGRRGIAVQERVVTGEASREIVAEAHRSRADLIALSSHIRPGVHEWPFGSVAERVLHTTSTPVLAVPGDTSQPLSIHKILIAVDGSEESLEVVAPAAELAWALGASVVLAHAGKRFPPAMPMAQKILALRKVPCETRLLRGEPAEAILKALETEKADLLALTTTGESRKDHLFFGRVAEEILKKCGRPILVVHTGRTV